MSYFGYVVAAYAVFFVVLLWDFVAPRIDIARQLRAAKLRAARTTTRRPAPDATLSRTESE
ncbi:heme exporter protein CcmD [Lysobacter sp. A6]|uniref:Heme exporter protein D n=1 Tax=Noviluteimonas lactosilytica TaxID=2888523 RepID=A0ABS8JDY3_9GAMM|nr:heme exporter protein CcmD [Lysobacter lactosilyticus]MCC8361750.1 heme exporter protein CcmD [Lysobacter lactosilyticus]